MNCPRCKSKRSTKDGSIIAARGRVQRYKCSDCDKKYHPSLREQAIPIRQAYLDIESSQLTASFGHMISWALKLRGGEVLQDNIKSRTLTEEKRIVKSLIKALLFNVDEVITYYGCVTPGHRVLRADLQWVPVETLGTGDKLLAFDATGPRRHWCESTVLHNNPILKEAVEVTLDDGTVLVVSEDHPFLTLEGRWQPAGNWQSAPIARYLDVWTPGVDRDAGWLAGFADGEGALAHHAQITMAQNVGTVLAEAEARMRRYGFSYTLYQTPDRGQMRHMRVTGGTREGLRFLGLVRPSRLLNKFTPASLGELKAYPQRPLRPVSIRQVGKQIVMGLGTTSQTYFVEGFGSHNTRFDIPFIRTRALHHGLDFPGYMSMHHLDLYYVARNRMRLHSNRLASVCEFLGIAGKTPLSPKVWVAASFGNKEAIAYIAEHNIADVKILEKVHEVLEPFMRGIRRSI